MKDQTVEFLAKVYVYDLNNCASEFGFKADENWEVGMASSSEKADLEKKYFPTLSARVLPEMLAEMMSSVKFKLSQPLAVIKQYTDTRSILQQELQYLVAYSPNRLRR